LVKIGKNFGRFTWCTQVRVCCIP